MRAGASTVQQALTTEASTLVKQSLCLARRRGHAQVTPLHVVSAMLSSPAGLLRAACLRSHSHPLQCKALELCFSVALNRLPATSSSIPLLGHHHHHRLHAYHHPPAISNALVAAFKRAQTHRRRGMAESQQPLPLLTVKVELEQLIVSVLDDPSVSRVMREAGFSSTQVKANVEKASISSDSPILNNKGLESEGMASSVLEILAGRKKWSVAVVAESLSSSQAAVSRLMEMVSRGEVPESVRGVRFITIDLSSFVSMSMIEVQQKVAELRRHVRSCFLGRGAALYIGDLDWAAEYWSGSGEKRRRSSFCPVESVVREISKMVLSELAGETRNGGFLWLLSSATQQGYMRCREGDPSLEILLGLNPLAVHDGSLNFSLNNGSERNTPVICGNKSQDGTLLGDGIEFQSETMHPSAAVASSNHGQISCNLPSWLQPPQEEKRKEYANDDQDSSPPKDQCRYWNFMESSGDDRPHQRRIERTLSFSSAFQSSSPFFEQNSFTWPSSAPASRVCSPEHGNPNSTSSSDAMDVDCVSRFRELSAKSLKILCTVLETEVPRHKEVIPEIVSTVLQCRSGMLQRKERSSSSSSQRKEDTWLLFEGNDCEGKEKIAMELANAIFGSRASFISINAGRFSVEQFFVALRDNSHRVILLSNAEQLDYDYRITIKEGIEGGRMRGFGREEEGFGDAIVILSFENFVSRSRARSPVKRNLGDDGEKEEEGEEIRPRVCLDLNLLSEDEMNSSELGDAGLLEAVDGVFLLESA